MRRIRKEQVHKKTEATSVSDNLNILGVKIQRRPMLVECIGPRGGRSVQGQGV